MSPANQLQCIDAIKLSLLIEEAGLVFYRQAARKVKNQKVRDMFNQLAEQEKAHVESLREKARFLQPTLYKKSEGKMIDRGTAQNLKSDIFPDAEEKLASIIKNDIDALDLGIESEERSIKALSHLLAEEKKLDVRAIFTHLIVEEKGHLAALQQLRKSLASS